MMLFCGDPHGRFDHIVRVALEHDAAAVVLLGDIEAQRPLHEALEPIKDRVWLIHGNHDTDSEANWAHVWRSELVDRNIDGQVVTLPNGVRIAGLGGVFRQTVWHPDPGSMTRGAPVHRSCEEHARVTPRQDRWSGMQPRKHWSSIYPAVVDKLADLQADILVTHEAPGYHPYGFEILDTLAQSMGVKVLIHGHQHDALDSSARWTQQGFKSYGVGLRGVTAVDANGMARILVPGELDADRKGRR
jgi:predicted phosphodiesterase